MKTTVKKKSLSCILYVLLAAAVVLTGVWTLSGCKDSKTDDSEGIADTSELEVEKLGEGEKSFKFDVVDGEGKTLHSYEISTDAETVGEALQQLGLIEGEEGPYGLYVKSVCGIRAVYEEDGTYWAFYANGEYAVSGVDVTAIENGTTYSFRVEK